MKALRYAWGLPVGVAIFLAGTAVRTEQPRQLTVQEWQQRVSGHIGALIRQQAQLSQRIASCEQQINFNAVQIARLGQAVSVRRQARPIIMQAPPLFDAHGIESQLRGIKYELMKENFRKLW